MGARRLKSNDSRNTKRRHLKVQEAIEELRNSTTAGAATFLVKVKAHRADEENLQMKKPISKQTRLFQAKLFPRNGATGQIEQSSHGKDLTEKKVR